MMLIRFRSTALALIAISAMADCLRADAAFSGERTSALVLRIGNGDEPQDLDPQTITGEPEYRILMALFEGLAEMDPKDLHPVPGLAQSWEVSPDGLVYTFHLRPNLKWSNGDPLTADDFIQSYRRMLSPSFASEYAYLLYNFVRGAREYYDGKLADFSQVGFKALDDRTLQVTLKHATPYLLKIIAQHWAWYPLPVKVIAKFGAVDQRGNTWTRPENLVGSGPYVIKSWVAQEKIVVTRNPNFWDAANVRSDRIEFYPTQDLYAEERMFRGGQLDTTYDLPRTKIDGYRRNHADELHVAPWLSVYYYECNVTRPPLNDKRVRQALAMAIDREAIVRRIVRGGEQPAYAITYPGASGYTAKAQLHANLDEARRLLSEAGYPGGRGFPVTELLYNTYETHRDIAEAVQAMWSKNLGIEIRLHNEEWKVYEDAVQHHNYQMARAGWGADYVDPQPFLEIFETGNGNNFTAWSNPEYDRLLHAALAAKNDGERFAYYQKMDAILVDECPVIPIYYYTRVYAMNPKMRGYWPNLLDLHPWKYVYREP
jgi:oligopeptide transport system substrate-binding protein